MDIINPTSDYEKRKLQAYKDLAEDLAVPSSLLVENDLKLVYPRYGLNMVVDLDTGRVINDDEDIYIFIETNPVRIGTLAELKRKGMGTNKIIGNDGQIYGLVHTTPIYVKNYSDLALNVSSVSRRGRNTLPTDLERYTQGFLVPKAAKVFERRIGGKTRKRKRKGRKKNKGRSRMHRKFVKTAPLKN